MNEDEDRGVWPRGGKHVECLDRRRPISEAFRSAEPRPHGGARAREALDDLPDHRRISVLVIGGIELDLVEVHPHRRTFFMRRRADKAGLGQGRVVAIAVMLPSMVRRVSEFMVVAVGEGMAFLPD